MQRVLITIAIIIAVPVILFVGYIGYTIYNVSHKYSIANIMKGETKRTIEQTSAALEYQKILIGNDKERYQNQLTADADFFAQHGTGDAEAFRSRIIATADSLKNLMVNESVADYLIYFFRVANIEYGRHHKLTFSEEVVNKWIVENLSFQDRLNMIVSQVLQKADTDSDPGEDVDTLKTAIYNQVREVLLADIDQVKADPTMSSAKYESLVRHSLQEFDRMELKPDHGNNQTMVYLIPKTYHDVSKLLGANVVKPLTEWFNRHTAYTPPSFDELTENAHNYLHYMEDGGFVNGFDKGKITAIVDRDIELFRHSSDTTMLTRTAVSSLKNIEKIAGDTEDREFFAALYCDLAHNRGFSIGKEVNIWMYGEPDEELEEEVGNRMPWD